MRSRINLHDGAGPGWLLLLLLPYGVRSGLLRDFLPGWRAVRKLRTVPDDSVHRWVYLPCRYHLRNSIRERRAWLRGPDVHGGVHLRE